MNTHPKLNTLIEKLEAQYLNKPIYNNSISYSNTDIEIHFFNSFNQTIVAIECLKPKVESETNKQIIEDIFARRNQIDLPNFIKQSTYLEDFKLQLQKPFLIIDAQEFTLRISIFDSINNAYIKNGLLKLLAVHNKEYNLKPKKKNTFYEKENTVFELVTSITLCRLNGVPKLEKNEMVYEWNGYRLIVEIIGSNEIENLKSFYPIEGAETNLSYRI